MFALPKFQGEEEGLVVSFHQKTIRNEVRSCGIGLHSGERIDLVLRPAGPDSGVIFVRGDLPSRPAIEASAECVVDTTLATSLGSNGTRISTIEHLMAAVAGMGIDNLEIEVGGAEVPIMDGSAAPFVSMLKTAGTVTQRAVKKFIRVDRPFRVQDGDKFVEILPSHRTTISYSIDFHHPMLADQDISIELNEANFEKSIARARTFGFLKDAEYLRRNGLALGASLENAVVLDEHRILNEEGLRYPDEFVRHKVLDFIGDLALLGHPLMGECLVHKSGHAFNHEVVRALKANPDYWHLACFDEPPFHWTGKETRKFFSCPQPLVA
jgi:UDP-3-O-[3-hydroxymyristoyl] N-acetylglucosamine deacetylase